MADKDFEKVSGGSLAYDERIQKTHGSGTGRRQERTAAQSLAGGLAGGLADGLVNEAPALAGGQIREELLKRLPFGSVLDDDAYRNGIILNQFVADGKSVEFSDA